MSVLHLEVCPICGAKYSLVRQTSKSGGSSQISYACSKCDSVLLWLGDDLWLQADRWAYQKVGREDKAYLLHASLTVEELRQLASQAQPKAHDEAPAASVWQASESGWEAVPTEEEGPEEPLAGPEGVPEPLDQGAWNQVSEVGPASEAEVSAEYEWLDAPQASRSRDDAAPVDDDWFQEPIAVASGVAGLAELDAWFEEPPAFPVEGETFPGQDAAVTAGYPSDEVSPAGPDADDVVLAKEAWFEEPSTAPQKAAPAEPSRGKAGGHPSAKQRRSRGSPFLVVSVVLTMLCLFCSAAVMILSTNLSGKVPQGILPANPSSGVPAQAETAMPTAVPAMTGPAAAPNPSSAIEFQGVTAYLDNTGSHYLVGEVLNRTQDNLRFVEILASFYDSDGQLISTGSTFSELSIIEPGGVAPFKLAILDPPPSLADYKLRADYLTSNTDPLALEVVNHSSQVAENGWHYIAGEVRNPHEFPVRFPEIVATYYNPSHQVLRVEAVLGALELLQPGDVTPFEIVLVDPPDDLQHYALQTESVRE